METKYLSMTIKEYQQQAMTTCFDECHNPMYMLFGLAEEVGEVHGKLAKAIRRGKMGVNENILYAKTEADSTAINDELMKEAGDVLWMLAGLCDAMGWELEDVARMNLEKLAERKASKTIIDHDDH